MSKASGWNRWRARYNPQSRRNFSQRGRDQELPKDRESLERFAESDRQGPVARELWNQELVEYNDKAEIVVNQSEVQAQARSIAKDTQDASYPREYIVKLYKEQTPGAENLNTQDAERAVNRHYAAKAQAVLTAAEVGKVKLTDAQRERLQRVANGEYLNVKYSQYKSGDRGTLVGVKKEVLKARSQDARAMADERRRDFYENVYKHGGGRKRKKTA
jgi:hypothetical protein